MGKSRAVTSVDVARRAGVSRATVSVVMSGSHTNIRVSARTRDRVLKAAAELGYAPHPAAQALRRQRTGSIGFVPRPGRGSPYDNPIPYLLSTHLVEAATRRGFHIIEATAETARAAGSTDLGRFLLSRRVDGVVFDRPDTSVVIETMVERGVPVVQVIRPLPDALSPTVAVDPGPGIVAAVNHLVSLGHRQIAYVGVGGSHRVERARLDSFCDALALCGITPQSHDIQLGSDYRLDEGLRLTQRLLDLPGRPTAIFAAGDSLALGVLRALYAAAVHVPSQMSLISYDDAFAAHLYPPLSSVVQPIQAVAEHAIALLTAGLEPAPGAESAPVHLVLPTHLIPRASTAIPRSAPGLGDADLAAALN
jgi:DNA-binding LacI/PurR family transcriptional regulator